VAVVAWGRAAQGATLSLPGNAGGSPGSSSTILLSIDDATGILATDIVISYDPAVVTVDDVTPTAMSMSHVLTHNLSPPGLSRISLYGTQPLGGSGALLSISVTAGDIPGSRTALALTFADLNEGGIPVTLIDGQFCVAGVGEEVRNLRAGLLPASTATRFVWDPHPYTGVYNLYRGTRPDLADLACLLPGVTGTSADDDGTVPAPGGGFVFLVTGVGCSGETSAGRNSAGAERVLPFPCP
jgi:hypothetical protein